MRFVLTLLSATLFSTATLAAGYNEKKSGDLSNDGATPTVVKLKLGANVITGKFGAKSTPDGTVTDRDYFTVKIPVGQKLTAIMLDPETVIGNSVSFIGVQSGKKVTVPPVGGSPADLLGWTHFSTSDEGTDILPQMGTGFGSQGFVPPLGPGTYSFWVQETSICTCKYKFTFQVTQ